MDINLFKRHNRKQTQVLVDEVKHEMMTDGLRYGRTGRPPLLDKEPVSGKRNRVIKPAQPYSPPVNKVQFRGTPDESRRGSQRMLIKTNHDTVPILSKRGRAT